MEIQDGFGGVEKFNFGLEKSPIIGDKKSGLGAKRRCIFHDKTSALEEIIEYEENKSFKVELSEFSMPMKSMYAGFKVTKLTATSYKVSMFMNFEVKFDPLGALMGLVMMRPMMKGVQKKILSGLTYHAFTGKTITSKLPPSKELPPAIAHNR